MGRRWPRPDSTAFWQTASLGSGLAASILVAAGSFSVTPETIADAAGTYWGRNPHVVRALARQAAEGQAGVWLLVLSVVFGFCALRAESRPLAEERSRPAGWCVGLTLAGALAVAAFIWAGAKAATLAAAVP